LAQEEEQAMAFSIIKTITEKIIIIIYLNKEGLNNTRIIKVNTVQRKIRIDFHSLPIIASIPQ
jgi:hypothetical protein